MDNDQPPVVTATLLVPLQNSSCAEAAEALLPHGLMGLHEEHSWMSNRTELQYELNPGEVATASIFFGALWLFSIFGNSLVCLVIHRSRRTQSTTNYFVVSMACADLLISVASTPFVVLQFTTGRWTLGSAMCKVVRYFQYLTPGVQIYVLLSICIDRFYTIVYPLSFKVSREKAKKMIAASWILDAAFVTPVFFFYGSNWDSHCNYFLPPSWEGTAYTVIHFLVGFVIPSILIILFYQKVIKYIWRIGTDGRTLRRTMNIVPRTKVKTVKMFLLLNLVFLFPLTENKMVFRRCTVSGIEYSHDANAQRLARYQEADSEEEEVVSKVGTISHRGSTGSHQSIWMTHKTQSIKSHRRTGSRAEAKRASMLSKHTAFSSPMEKDITPDPKLLEKVSECDRFLAIARHQEHPLAHLSPELSDVFDFFIALTICNTVVVTSPDQPRQKVRVRFELKSPVKTIEDFLRRFTPSRLASGCSSIGNLSTSKSSHKSGSAFLPSLSQDSMLLGLEEKLGQTAPSIASNGYASQAGQEESWASECTTDQKCPGEQREQQEGELRYEAESPDEAALVYAARAYNCALVDRLHDQVSVELPHLGRLTFELLHTLGFDSIRKRMSVVIRHPLTDEINVYTKGADSVVMDLLLPCSSDDARGRHQKKIRSKTQNYLNLYAVEGLRTLCIAKRVLSKEEYACWLQSHIEAEASVESREELLFQSAVRLETNLHLLGATGIEDRLQEGVPETIAKLRQAGLQIWVLTGDKQETAINIAYACKLLDHGEEVITLNADSQEACAALLDQCLSYVQSRNPRSTLQNSESNLSVGFSFNPVSTSTDASPSPSLVIDGRSLAYALEKSLEDKFLFLAKQCRSVLCCRSTPLQKSMVVKLVRSKLKAMTLAIGDGANDVSMIQVADVGVGISGQEGMQAVMASDFAVPRFRYLERLLIVHGHWCYSRLANMVLYFFYKNTMFVGLLFWFQFYCGFSASAMIDQWYLIFFNLLFSSLPQLVTGVLDKDVPADMLLREPQLYKSGQNMEEYRPRAFWLNMVDAAFQSLVCFFIPYLAYYDSDVDVFTWGTPVTAIALFTFLLHLGIETKTWTWLNWLACGFSTFLFFSVALIYNTSCATCYPPSNPYWTMQTLLGDPLFYLTCLIAPIAALLPRLFFKALQGSLFPTQLQLGRQLAKKPLNKFSDPKETFAQGQPPGHSETELSERKTMGPFETLPRDCASQASQFTQQLTCSPEASGEPSAVDTNMPLRENTLLEGLGSQASGSSMPRGAISEVCPGDSKRQSTSASQTARLSSLFHLPSFGSLNWISSLSLASGLGSVLQLSGSSLQMDKQDGEFLSNPPQPEQDLHSFQGQVTGYL